MTLTWQQAQTARRYGPGLAAVDLRELRQRSALGMAGAAGMATQSATSLTRQATAAVTAAATDPAVDVETVLTTSLAGHAAIAVGVARLAGRPVNDTLQQLQERLLQLGRWQREHLATAPAGKRQAARSDKLAARRAHASPRVSGPMMA